MVPRLRAYAPGDAAECLGIFDSNVPRYFAPDERDEFADFLAGLHPKTGRHLVLTDGDRIVACGGLSFEEPPRAALAWGMVDAALQGRGLGWQLTAARLDLARAMPELSEVTLATSQHTAGFYARFGFVTTRVVCDGFGPGLHRCDMRLCLR